MKTACIDIGGTYIKSGILVGDALTDIRETPTQAQRGGQAVLDTVAALVRDMNGIDRVGISTAGEVDAVHGSIRFACNIPGYTGLPVKALLEQALSMPVAVENDVNAAAIGELAYGAGQGKRDFLMVSYGTGVGGAIIESGAVYHGASDSAGEFGGLITHPEAITEEQGTGSYERYASVTALIASVQAQYPALTDGRAIFAALADAGVKRLVDAWIEEISHGLISLIHVFNPSMVVLGGGIMREAYILKTLQAMIHTRIKPSFTGCALVPARLGNNAGMMGAGYLVQSLK